MSYSATQLAEPRAFSYPVGVENTQHLVTIRGYIVEDSANAGNYALGGFGSSQFEVTDVTAAGVATYGSLSGLQLLNGQWIYYSGSTHFPLGAYQISKVTPSSGTAGTFSLGVAGTHDATLTAQGVGQVQWGIQALLAQTFTVATVPSVTATTMTFTYTTLTGPQLFPGDQVTLSSLTNAGNNGTFTIISVVTSSGTAGTVVVSNSGGVASDSGSGVGNFNAGIGAAPFNNAPVMVKFFSSLGYDYRWNAASQTIKVFLAGTATDALDEAALGGTVAFDPTLTFEAIFSRSDE